jgi:peroxiredoxin
VGFPLLSDWGGRKADAFGVRYDVWKGHEGVAKRSRVVIDRRGIIRYRWVTDDALTLPDIDETVSVVEQLTAEAS